MPHIMNTGREGVVQRGGRQKNTPQVMRGGSSPTKGHCCTVQQGTGVIYEAHQSTNPTTDLFIENPNTLLHCPSLPKGGTLIARFLFATPIQQWSGDSGESAMIAGISPALVLASTSGPYGLPRTSIRSLVAVR